MNTNNYTDRTQRNSDSKAAADTASDASVCNGCGKHCSLKNPSCGKGSALARERGITAIGDTGGFSGHSGSEKPWRNEKVNSGEIDRTDHHRHKDSMNHHGHPRHEVYDFENCEDLDLLFRSCAHLLYHKGRHRGSREQILMNLVKNGPVAQKDIQDELRIQPGSVSELLSKLEKRGLIVRGKSMHDKRAVIIRLTEKGRDAAVDRMQENETSPFDVLSRDEKAALLKILRKLLAYMS